VLIIPTTLTACSSFILQDSTQILLAKNLDWEINNGIILINKKGVLKTAYGDNQQKFSWTSNYGSVTFNQFGKEFPLGGMNEKGLVIEELNSWGETPDYNNNKYQMNEFQWTQFCLDNYSNVEELLEFIDSIVIVPLFINLHYLISDSYGNSVIVEFYNRKRYLYKDVNLPYPILTNNHYNNSLKYLSNFKGFGGKMEIRPYNTSNERFVKIASMIKIQGNKNTNENFAFQILDSVSQSDTQWSIVYNISNKSIQFKTLQNKSIKTIDLAHLDFSCNTPTSFIEVINGKNFKELKPDDNKKLLMDVFDKYTYYNLGKVSKKEFLNLVDYGNSIKCQ
jgi:choloylglycine hydrolase